MTPNADQQAAGDRLRKIERGTRLLFVACFALYLVESLITADGGPATFGRALLDWPSNFLLPLAAGCVATAVPFAPVRDSGIRIGALLVVCASIVWNGGLLVFLAFYMAAMSQFD